MGASLTVSSVRHDAATGSTSGGPASRNPIMTDDGGMRTSKIVGSSVYNDKDEKVGSIDDLIIGSGVNVAGRRGRP